MNADFDLR